MKPAHKRALIALCIAALIILIRAFGLQELLSVETFRQYREELLLMTSEHYLASVIIFTAVYMVAAALSIPGATLLTLTAGFLFGFFGVIYANIGATAGAILAFLTARYLIGDWIQKRYPERLASFNKEIAANGPHYLLTLRLIPLFPFLLVNVFAGISRVPWKTFAWTTMIGILPGSLVYIYTGRQLGGLEQPGDVLSWPVILAFVLLGLLVLSPVIIKKFMMRKTVKSIRRKNERELLMNNIWIPPSAFFLMGGLCFAQGDPGRKATVRGMLKPCPASPNCVSSQAKDPGHAIAPLIYHGSRTVALALLKQVLAEMKRTVIVAESEDDIHAEVRSLIFRFVDDLEFYFPTSETVIHVRSASRVGDFDLGVNRRRVEEIRRRFSAKQSGLLDDSPQERKHP